MLGVNAAPSSVSYGLMEAAWRRTLGWRQLNSAEAGSQRKLMRTIFDN